MARIALLTAFALACSAETGPPGPPGTQGEPGAQGPQGERGQDGVPGLSVTGEVSCVYPGQTEGGEPVTYAMAATFFSSGWTFSTATLIATPDDHSQSDFFPPGADPAFVFEGPPLLSGVVVATMALSDGAMVWSQGDAELVVAGWGTDRCVDAR